MNCSNFTTIVDNTANLNLSHSRSQTNSFFLAIVWKKTPLTTFVCFYNLCCFVDIQLYGLPFCTWIPLQLVKFHSNRMWSNKWWQLTTHFLSPAKRLFAPLLSQIPKTFKKCTDCHCPSLPTSPNNTRKIKLLISFAPSVFSSSLQSPICRGCVLQNRIATQFCGSKHKIVNCLVRAPQNALPLRPVGRMPRQEIGRQGEFVIRNNHQCCLKRCFCLTIEKLHSFHVIGKRAKR